MPLIVCTLIATTDNDDRKYPRGGNVAAVSREGAATSNCNAEIKALLIITDTVN